MPLVAALKADTFLQPFIRPECDEPGRGFRVTISAELATDDVVIIKPDAYYNSPHGPRPAPKSPDCLVVVRCETGEFQVFLVELRDIRGPLGFSVEEIREKFNTCLHDFMEGVLGSHFNRADIRFSAIRLLFVTDPYGQQQDQERNNRFNRSTKMDALLALNSGRPFRFDGRRLGIEHHINDPAITRC